METRGSADADDESRGRRKRKATDQGAAMLDDDDHLEEDLVDEEEEKEEAVNQVEVLEGLKHGDGSIYKKIDVYCWLYRLGSSEETSLQPMRLTLPTAECGQQPTCGHHVGSPMLQIFSVKLTKLPAAAATASSSSTSTSTSTSTSIELYGFMAVRDLMDPLRNYVFNRTREDPLVIPDLRSDPFIYLSGPKRGVHMRARVLFEYHLRIKRDKDDGGDLPLIDGVAIFSEKTGINEPATYRIGGYGGAAVDVRRALVLRSVEATVQVWIHELLPLQQQQKSGGAGGLELSISASFAPTTTTTTMAATTTDDDDDDEIKLFRGIIQKPCALNRFVVAVPLTSSLILHFRVPAVGGERSSCDDDDRRIGQFAFKGTAHGSTSDCRKFDFATVEVKVTWSPMH